MLGSLGKEKLTLCEIRRFENAPIREKNSVQWNIPSLYRETIEGLRSVGAHEDPVQSISCSSWGSDYMLFENDGTLISPTFHYSDPRSESGMKEVLSKVPWETIYDETGVQKFRSSTLIQLGAEKSKRLKGKYHLLPVADGFNYLLAGVPRVEMSSASATQLYNPVTKHWSERLLQALRLPSDLFPQVVPAGTRLGDLRPEIAKETGLADEPSIITSCSHELAAALVGLPVMPAEDWAYLRTDGFSDIGTQLVGPIINEVSREWNFTNELCYGGAARFSKRVAGLWILEECKRFWRENDREVDGEMLMHLATAAEPFESLIDLTDPRFETPGDMPLKIQAFCKETGQTVPRKPGPATRCILESLALLYRRTMLELEQVTGRKFTRLYLLEGKMNNSLLNHFTANALQVPTVVAPRNMTSIGNVIVQALALRHIPSLDAARAMVRNSFKMDTIMPHAAAWDAAYTRLTSLAPVESVEEPKK